MSPGGGCPPPIRAWRDILRGGIDIPNYLSYDGDVVTWYAGTGHGEHHRR